jgi:hypothetical protein
MYKVTLHTGVITPQKLGKYTWLSFSTEAPFIGQGMVIGPDDAEITIEEWGYRDGELWGNGRNEGSKLCSTLEEYNNEIQYFVDRGWKIDYEFNIR